MSGKEPVRIKTIINDRVSEQVKNLNFMRIIKARACRYEVWLDTRFQMICEIIVFCKNMVRTENKLKFYIVMAVHYVILEMLIINTKKQS